MELRDDTTVYVLANEKLRFVGMTELSLGRKWVYAFTSPQKAKEFLRMARQKGMMEKTNRLFPCTLAEWFDLQAKQQLPDLAVDPDPEQHQDYPLLVGDAAKHNITCLTKDMPHGGKIWQVAVSPRTDA